MKYWSVFVMDPQWPENPSDSVICILCKAVLPFVDSNPEKFFRHLITDHCSYYNLNMLLEVSLLQPTSVSEEQGVVEEGGRGQGRRAGQ